MGEVDDQLKGEHQVMRALNLSAAQKIRDLTLKTNELL